jgi:hypothetical protein
LFVQLARLPRLQLRVPFPTLRLEMPNFQAWLINLIFCLITELTFGSKSYLFTSNDRLYLIKNQTVGLVHSSSNVVPVLRLPNETFSFSIAQNTIFISTARAIEAWNLSSGNQLASYQIPSPVYRLISNQTNILGFSNDKNVYMFDFFNTTKLQTHPAPNGTVINAFLDATLQVATDRCALLEYHRAWKTIWVEPLCRGWSAFAFHGTSAAWVDNQSIVIFNLLTKSKEKRLYLDSPLVKIENIFLFKEHAFATCADGRVRQWRLLDGRLEGLHFSPNTIESLVFQRSYISWSTQTDLTVNRSITEADVSLIVPSSLLHYRVSENGIHGFSALSGKIFITNGRQLDIWSLENMNLIETKIFSSSINLIGTAEKAMVMAHVDGSLSLSNDSLDELKLFQNPSKINIFVYSEKEVIGVASDGIRFWITETGVLKALWLQPTKMVSAIAALPSYVAIAYENKTVVIHNRATGTMIKSVLINQVVKSICPSDILQLLDTVTSQIIELEQFVQCTETSRFTLSNSSISQFNGTTGATIGHYEGFFRAPLGIAILKDKIISADDTTFFVWKLNQPLTDVKALQNEAPPFTSTINIYETLSVTATQIVSHVLYSESILEPSIPRSDIKITAVETTLDVESSTQQPYETQLLITIAVPAGLGLMLVAILFAYISSIIYQRRRRKHQNYGSGSQLLQSHGKLQFEAKPTRIVKKGI